MSQQFCQRLYILSVHTFCVCCMVSVKLEIRCLVGIYGAGCLITEGSRGEGGYLINSEVMCAIDLPLPIVSVYKEIKSLYPCMYKYVLKKFPSLPLQWMESGMIKAKILFEILVLILSLI